MIIILIVTAVNFNQIKKACLIIPFVKELNKPIKRREEKIPKNKFRSNLIFTPARA